VQDGEGKTEASLVYPEGRSEAAERLRGWEDAALEDAGFERVEGDVLWAKGGVCYGREAALQNLSNSATSLRKPSTPSISSTVPGSRNQPNTA
jgi:hypothetical protein